MSPIQVMAREIFKAINRLDAVLPEWLEVKQVQWVCWVYAMWQLLRRSPVVLFMMSWVPFQMRKRYRNKKYLVVLIPPSNKNIPRHRGPWYSDHFFTKHMPRTFEILPEEAAWPKEWRAVKVGEWYYFTTSKALDMMAKWISLCDGDEEAVIFVEKPEVCLVGEMVEMEEAYQKILSGDYYVYVIRDGRVVFPSLSDEDAIEVGDKKWGLMLPTGIKYLELNATAWGILSTLPTLIQACGFEKLSTLLAFIIIFLDFNRRWMFCLYKNLEFRFRVFIKSKILRHRTSLYVALALACGPQWLYSDEITECSYWARVGEHIKLHHYSRMKNLDDVSIYGKGNYVPFKDRVIRIWDFRGFGLWLDEGEEYAVATLNKKLFIE